MSVNKWIGIGNLGRDPEVRYVPNGDAVANLSIGCSEKYKDKAGQMVEHTEWVKVSFFGRTAEVCGQFLKKGSQVYVEGSIRTRKYTDKEGVEKFATEIRGDRMQMLGSKGEGTHGTPTPEQQRNRQAAKDLNKPTGGSSGFDDMDDDSIPF
jgi:single-strand DNA-binding protein